MCGCCNRNGKIRNSIRSHIHCTKPSTYPTCLDHQTVILRTPSIPHHKLVNTGVIMDCKTHSYNLKENSINFIRKNPHWYINQKKIYKDLQSQPTHFTDQSFIYSPTDALVRCLKNNTKIYIKIYIKTAPTCFGVTVSPSSGGPLIRAY